MQDRALASDHALQTVALTTLSSPAEHAVLDEVVQSGNAAMVTRSRISTVLRHNRQRREQAKAKEEIMEGDCQWLK